MPKLGIISTIGFKGTDFETKFRAGLNDAADYDVDDNLGYDDDKLKASVQKFDNQANYQMIVTVGGLKSAIAALNKVNNVPFISLVGGKTADFSGKIIGMFYGGISLETFGHNNDRFAHLKDRGFQHDEICLLINPNSPFQKDEKKGWPGIRVFEAKDSQEIKDKINNLDTTQIKAMVVSADPFFQLNRGILVQTANNKSGLYVCYPFQDYEKAGPTGKHTLHGPNLAKAHYRLGAKAASIIANNFKPSTFDLVDVVDKN
jgi:hypothetical protein